VREIPPEPEIKSMHFVSVAACLLNSVQRLLTALQGQRHKIYQIFWWTPASFFPEFIFITKSCYYTYLKLTRKITKNYYVCDMVNKHSSSSDLHFWILISLMSYLDRLALILEPPSVHWQTCDMGILQVQGRLWFSVRYPTVDSLGLPEKFLLAKVRNEEMLKWLRHQ
jgi:hypothetical protein